MTTGCRPGCRPTWPESWRADSASTSSSRGYRSPGELADDAVRDAWDVGNIGAEPARAETIAFTAAYCEIECTYLVPPGSPIAAIDEVDQPGRRVASAPRAAYDLWLERNLRHAELVRSSDLGGSFDLFINDGLDALAGLRPALVKDAAAIAGVTGARRQVLVGPAGHGDAARPRRRRVRVPAGVRRGDEGERVRRRPHRRPRRRRSERRSGGVRRLTTGRTYRSRRHRTAARAHRRRQERRPPMARCTAAAPCAIAAGNDAASAPASIHVSATSSHRLLPSLSAPRRLRPWTARSTTSNRS